MLPATNVLDLHFLPINAFANISLDSPPFLFLVAWAPTIIISILSILSNQTESKIQNYQGVLGFWGFGVLVIMFLGEIFVL